ncbi:hypothetical protein M6B38_307520 [Iris pallida]|uniref:Uncharacterized protein n=1 Tax=Iris pallida TaxID=29817 RepID=A0AAX6EAG3_IRIPA|nr:hypothetical protein M6B38_199550 [Iris pallida]KAJ6841142.1 hypothetical protein M6B38_307520 [Iris pallida]
MAPHSLATMAQALGNQIRATLCWTTPPKVESWRRWTRSQRVGASSTLGHDRGGRVQGMASRHSQRVQMLGGCCSSWGWRH